MFQLFPWDWTAHTWFRSYNQHATGNEDNFEACLVLHTPRAICWVQPYHAYYLQTLYSASDFPVCGNGFYMFLYAQFSRSVTDGPEEVQSKTI